VMSALRTWHVDAGVTGQVRTMRGARGGGASRSWSRFSLLFGLVSAGRTWPVTGSSGWAMMSAMTTIVFRGRPANEEGSTLDEPGETRDRSGWLF
jgi:hypothetical protein